MCEQGLHAGAWHAFVAAQPGLTIPQHTRAFVILAPPPKEVKHDRETTILIRSRNSTHARGACLGEGIRQQHRGQYAAGLHLLHGATTTAFLCSHSQLLVPIAVRAS